MKLNCAAVICVRMSSERLPGKALISYTPDGKSNLACIIDRVLTSRHHQTVIVATSTDPTDDPIAEWVKRMPTLANYERSGTSRYALYRGDLENVVKRFDGALQTHAPNADFVWRVMADCPLVDVGLVDWRLDVLARNKADVMTILEPEPTYAAQASVWSRAAWDYCAKMSSGSQLEHPGERIYNDLGEFKVLREIGPETVYYQDIRTELDTPEDLEFFRRVWKEYPSATEQVDINSRSVYTDYSYPTCGVLTWLSTRPDIVEINQHVEMKTKSIHLHGHPRARKYICQECNTEIANKINDRLDLSCPKCGTVRRFYL